jgi:hypothetical protein
MLVMQRKPGTVLSECRALPGIPTLSTLQLAGSEKEAAASSHPVSGALAFLR